MLMRIFQVLLGLATVLAGLYCYAFDRSAVMVVIDLAYFELFLGALWRNAWCRRLAFVPALAACLWTGPFVVMNFWMFFDGDPLYLDSPATILIVAVPAVLVVLPTACLLLLSAFTACLGVSRQRVGA